MNQRYVGIFSEEYSYKEFLPSSCLLWNITNWIISTFGVQRHKAEFRNIERGRGDRCFSRARSGDPPCFTDCSSHWHGSVAIDLLLDCDPEQAVWRREMRNWIDCMEKDFFLKGRVLLLPLKVELMWAFKWSLHDTGEQGQFWSQMYAWFGIPPYKELPVCK